MELIDSFKHTEQTSSVSAYIDTFEELMGKIRLRNPSLTEDYFVDCFVSSLKDHIKIHLRSHAPSSLVQTNALARNYEHSIHKRTQTKSFRGTSKGSNPNRIFSTDKTEKQDDKSKSGTRWDKEKCFKYQEPWVLGHNKTCKFRKQVNLISIQDGESSDEDTTERVTTEEVTTNSEDTELKISMHAMAGTSSHAKTFSLFIQVGNIKLLALVDTDSTTSFIDSAVIEKLDIPINNHEPVQVNVANGNIPWSHAISPNCSYCIQGHEFTSDFRVLEL
jgi:hypothetical protein